MAMRKTPATITTRSPTRMKTAIRRAARSSVNASATSKASATSIASAKKPSGVVIAARIPARLPSRLGLGFLGFLPFIGSLEFFLGEFNPPHFSDPNNEECSEADSFCHDETSDPSCIFIHARRIREHNNGTRYL